VTNARSNGAHRTATLDAAAPDESTPRNGTHNGTGAFTTMPYGEGAYDDNMDVDAASYDPAPGNGAPGADPFAGTATRPAPSTNGQHAPNGHTRNGQPATQPPTNGQANTRRPADGRADTRQLANGHADGRRTNGHVAKEQSGSGSGSGSGNGFGDAASLPTNGLHAPGNSSPTSRNGNPTSRNGDPTSRNGNPTSRNGMPSDLAGDPGQEFAGVGARGGSVTFGFGETAGVLPGDQRTFDDVEAGIVALWRQFGERREQPLRDRLVLHYAPLVKYVAGRVGTGLPAHVEVADLIQSGIFGLVDAIEKFEPERGLKFETYAMQRIRGAILDDLRAQDWVPRSVRGRAREVERALERLGAQLRRTPTDAELADELGLSLHELRDIYAQLQLTSVVALDELAAAGRGPTPLADILEDQEALDPVALLVDQDNRRQLAQAIAHLAERDRVVVTLYYFENLTLAEIGRVLGVTESRVCQLHTRAVLRLRAKLLEKTDA